MALIPLLPILIPLVGAALCLLGARSAAASILRRWFYVAMVALTGASVLVVWAQRIAILAPMPQAPYLNISLALLWTPLSFATAALLFSALLIGQIPRLHRPLPPESAALRLALLASSLAVVAAGNLLSLCLAWGVQPLVLLLLRATWRGSAAEPPSPWSLWSSLASTGCLLVGAIGVIAHQEGVLFLIEVQPGLALYALTASVALRVLSWPRVGGLRRNYEVYAMSLVTGLYLWLRIGLSLEADGPLLAGGLAIGVLLAASSVLSALYRTPTRALPYVLAHWLIIALLAPWLDPDTGFVSALLIAINLTLGLLALRVHQTSGISGLRLGRAPYLIAWASLGGLPLTVGFVAHWLLARSLWAAGASHLVFWILVSFLANAVPAWSQARFGEGDAPPEERTPALSRPTLYSSALASALLLSIGIYPALLSVVWPNAQLDLGALDYRRLWPDPGATLGLLLAATALGPLAAGLTLHLRLSLSGGISAQPFYRLRRTLNTEWLSLALKEQLDRLLATWERGFEVLEGSFSLGWVLLWGAALIYFLVSS